MRNRTWYPAAAAAAAASIRSRVAAAPRSSSRAISSIGRKDVLSFLCEQDPTPLMDSIRDVHGSSYDLQKMRWGRADLMWVLHVKESLKPSAYQPED